MEPRDNLKHKAQLNLIVAEEITLSRTQHCQMGSELLITH